MATQPELSRHDEIRLIWKEHQWLYAVIGFLGGLLCFPALQSVVSDLSGLLKDFVPEAIGIVITVIVIDRLNRIRDERNAEKQLKEQLVRDASSLVNDVAVNAVHQLRKRGWLIMDQGLLAGENLSLANLEGAQLLQANLQDAHLESTNLSGANLRLAKLVGADLRYANLEGATLRVANLSGTNLYFANLQGANLRWANLEGAILGEGREQVKLDQTTTLPDGTYWSPETDMTRFTHPERHAPTAENPLEESK